MASHFNSLFTKSVPHILEKIFFALDYKSFKECLEVSNSWNNLLTSERFQRVGQSVFGVDIEKELWNASRDGNTAEVKRILSIYRVDVNCVVGMIYSTPLTVAAKYGHKDVVRILLLKGADHSIQNRWGETPLDIANRQCDIDTADILRDL